eukprot:403361024
MLGLSQKLSKSSQKLHSKENQKRSMICQICESNVYDSSKHCGVCNRCTHQFDHHCVWLNNCIGGENYRMFMVLVVILAIQLGFNIGLTIYTITNLSDDRLTEQLESILSVFLDKFSGSISSNILHSKGEITEQEFDQWLYRTNPKNIRKNKSRVIIELDEESQKLSTRQKNKHNFQNQDLGDQIVVGGGEGGQINGPGDQQYQIDIGQELQQSQQEKVGQLLGEQAIIIEHQNINEPGNYQVDISKSLHLKSTVLNLEHQDYQHFKNKKNIKFYQKCKVLGWCCLNKQRKKVQDLMLQESQRNEEFNQDPNIHIQNLIINHKISNNNVFMNQKDQFEKSSNLTPSQVYDDQYYASNLNKNQQTIIHSHYQNSLNKQDKTRDFLKHGEQIHEIIDTQINALKTNGQLQANDKSPRTLLQTKNHVLESNHSFKNNAFQILKEMELNNLQDTFENTKSRQNE